MDKFRGFLDSFSSPGAITLLFFILTLVGAAGWLFGSTGGQDVFKVFSTALTTFSVGRTVGRNETGSNNNPIDPNKK